MTHRLAALAQQREELNTKRRRIRKAYCLVVLDHIAEEIRQVCPEAAYIGFTYDGATRDTCLIGVLGEAATRLGGLPWLWETSEEEHPLAELAVRIEADVRAALEPYDSPAWANVRRDNESEGNLRLIELPPADRVARVAQLVREHYPKATAVVVEGTPAGGRVTEVIEGVADDGTENRVRCLWMCDCDDTVTRLVAQIFAIQAVAEHHLVLTDGRYDGTPGGLVHLPLPPTT